MGKVIGIDLGTTNTAVAVLEKGRPRVIEDDKGYKVLPSCVSAKADGDFIVGQAARNKILTDPDRTVYAIKRLIGRRYDSPQVEEAKRRMPFRIEPASDGGCLVALGEQLYTPIEVCSIILQVAKQIAERALGDTVDEAVITVPAYFNHQQRTATFEAAKLAGLHCERLLNEPTAAALAFGFKKQGERTVALYDLGGGTFDISVLRLSNGVYEILSTRGDTYLGGEDFDFRIVDWLADQFQSEHGIDLREDRTSLQRLKDASERAKCELSFADKTTILVPRVTPELNLERAFDRLTLEGLVEDLIGKTLQTVRKAVGDSGLQLADVDDVILVGGQTRMPRVREAISGLFGKEPSRGVHPEEVVAIGAAVHAYSLTDVEAKRPVLLDVTPFDLGIDIAGGLFQPIITRNSQIPTSQTQSFSTTRDNQESVRVTVRQGEHRNAQQNEFLGEFVMSGLTPAPAMRTRVEISFRLDANGMLHVSGTEPETGEEKHIVVRNYAEVARGESASGPSVAGDVQKERGKSKAAEPKADGKQLKKKGKELKASTKDAPAKSGATSRTSDAKALLGSLLGRARRLGKAPGEEPNVAAAAASSASKGAKPKEKPAPPRTETSSGISLDDLAPSPVAEVDDAPAHASSVDAYADEEGSAVAAIGLAGGGFPDESLSMPEDADAEEPSDTNRSEWEAPLVTNPGGYVQSKDILIPEGEGSPDLFAMPEAEEPMEEPLYSLPPAPGHGHDAAPAEPHLDDAFAMPDEAAEPAWDDGGFGNRTDPAQEFDREAARVRDQTADWDDDDTQITKRASEKRMRPRMDTFVLPAEGSGTAEGDAAAAAGPIDPGDVDFKAPRAKAPEPPPVEELSPDDDDDSDVGKSATRKKKKRAKIKLSFRKAKAMVAEYRDNIKRGGCFVKTAKPLPVGREVKLEIKAPGLEEPLGIPGIVTWSSLEASQAGQDVGMTVEYQLDERARRELERVLDSLA